PARGTGGGATAAAAPGESAPSGSGARARGRRDDPQRPRRLQPPPPRQRRSGHARLRARACRDWCGRQVSQAAPRGRPAMRYARSPRFALSLCVALVAMARAAGAVPITVNYNDGAGEGFNDTTAVAPIGGNPKVTLGEQRKFAFEFAMGLWSSALQGTVNIEIDATMDPLGGTATSAILGFGGSTTIHINFPGAPFANTFYSAALANQLSGGDVNGAGMAEIQITMNSDVDNSKIGRASCRERE